MPHPIIDSPRDVSLAAYDPDDTGGLKKQEVESKLLPEFRQTLSQLQDLQYGAHQHSVLIILQGMDTSGKDGTIRHVMSGVNPTGCYVWSFKVPTEEELKHDFLWRVHAHTPELGTIAIFNRSHYEDVLVARVHNLVPREVWKRRYDQINAFEQLLTESGTVLLKFFLHISKDEQERRLLEREQDIEKAWKLSVGDWKEREHWDDYVKAYEEALGRCSTSYAPWHIVPADKKWYRNYVISQAIVERLEPLAKGWRKSLKQRSEQALAELRAFHAQEEPRKKNHAVKPEADKDA
ncbi:MAG TPA: PPK2 family polyphosphate kinase [Ktedonobacterales bacterium]|nr:PPK2 family polyphosphate kinase [Ktedonobacterales bacterium]